jgi:uncharacterized protein YndB with AHSA1/START domain
VTDAYGTIIDGADGTSSIRFERRLPFPIEAVWAALTEQEQLNQWFSAGKLEPREAGMVDLAGPKHIPVEGSVRVWDPPHVLELDWRQHNIGRTTVRYELVADGPDTILTLVHSGLRPRDARGYGPGQHAFLDRLAAHLGGTRIPEFDERYAEVQPAYA